MRYKRLAIFLTEKRYPQWSVTIELEHKIKKISFLHLSIECVPGGTNSMEKA
jgi:hypothetical protein